ncbi:MAG: DUF6056 family protein [Kofleriaceae bacterium]
MVQHRAWLWWAAIVVPLWALLVYGTYWEPVQGDGWGHILWLREHDVSLASVWQLVRDAWLYENPRIGQTFTMLMYVSPTAHVIVTPVIELVLFALATTFVLGRLPSLRRAGDALAFATVTAIVVACTPQLGSLLFYRPFVGNYTCGHALALAWLLPFRLSSPAARLWLAPVELVLGFVAGMCNEHTGLAVIGVAVVVIGVRWRRGEQPRVWMLAALAGFITGYAMLMGAPGQALRYDELATKAGLVERIVERGVVENFEIVGYLVVNVALAIPWLVLGFVARRSAPRPLSQEQRASLILAALAGLVATLALLGSPRIGPRLYFASTIAVAIAISGWVIPQLTTAWSRRTCAGLAAIALAVFVSRCLTTYGVAGPIAAERLARIEAASPGSTVIVPRMTVGPTRWFIGDDFAKRRETVALIYSLAAIVDE